jgi:hypothetical protein
LLIAERHLTRYRFPFVEREDAMKKILGIVAAGLLVASFGLAEEPAAPKPHALFDRLKPPGYPALHALVPRNLVGTWEATVNGQKIRTSYSIGSSGSTLVENLMPETAGMLDVIHADGDALMMTHYCAGANQPRYRATKFEGNKITFKFLDGTNIGDSYMSGLTLTLVDADHMTQEWSSTAKGKMTGEKFEFARVK